MQVWSESDHGLPVTPGRGVERVAGGHEQRLAGDAGAARRPDTAAACTCGPACHFPRVLERNSHHPAAVIPAITEMTTKWHVEHPGENSQRTALILVTRIEGLLHRPQCVGDIDRPSRQDQPVL